MWWPRSFRKAANTALSPTNNTDFKLNFFFILNLKKIIYIFFNKKKLTVQMLQDDSVAGRNYHSFSLYVNLFLVISYYGIRVIS